MTNNEQQDLHCYQHLHQLPLQQLKLLTQQQLLEVSYVLILHPLLIRILSDVNEVKCTGIIEAIN
jgi:hypothetical protein